MSTDALTSADTSEEGDRRTATVNHAPDGEPLGAAVFLDAEELAQLGVDPDAVGVVTYWVEDGELCVGRPQVAGETHD